MQPHECSHAFCAHNLISINSYLSGISKLVSCPYLRMNNIDSYNVGFFIVLRSYVCRILGLYQVLTLYVGYTNS